VVGGITNWCCVDSGGGFNLALRTDGTLWGWGNSYCGQFALFRACRSSPVCLSGGFTGWVSIGAGYAHGVGATGSYKGF
jgi:alpha-tubulin suppressor-like RCC1 family protein